MKKIDIKKWDVYWWLTIIEEVTKRWQHRRIKCLCKCWNEKIVSLNSIRMWETKSCWCYHKIKAAQANTTHWMSYTRIYHIWEGIAARCNNHKHKNYIHYWWRWIYVERENFEEFYKDMWDSYKKHINEYWEKNTTIDRINNDWGYCKNNCRWATRKEQVANQRKRKDSVIYNISWEELNVKDLSRIFWVKYTTLTQRLYRDGLHIVDALTK